MKFDFVIGNPPYQVEDAGTSSGASPVYHDFVNEASQISKEGVVMIIPSRWFAGGKGLDKFRKEMLEGKHLVKMVDYVNAKDCFPNTSIGGGVNYFLLDKSYIGECTYTNIHDGKESTCMRDTSEFELFVRYNEAISIIHKVIAKSEESIVEYIGGRNPYGFSTADRGNISKLNADDVKIFSSQGIGWVNKSAIKSGKESIDKYKIMISRSTGEHAGEPSKSGKFSVLSRMELLRPNEICTDSYLIAYVTEDKEKAENFFAYMKTKFLRFLLLQAVSSISLSRDKFMFIPKQDFSIRWTDKMLYEKYELSILEEDFIEEIMKEMH